MDIWTLYILHDQLLETSFTFNLLECSLDIQRQLCEKDSLNSILLVCFPIVSSITIIHIVEFIYHCYVIVDNSGVFTLTVYYKGLGFHLTFHRCNNIMSTSMISTDSECQPKSIMILNCFCYPTLGVTRVDISGANSGLGYTL